MVFMALQRLAKLGPSRMDTDQQIQPTSLPLVHFFLRQRPTDRYVPDMVPDVRRARTTSAPQHSRRRRQG